MWREFIFSIVFSTMQTKKTPFRVIMLETARPLSAAAQNILYGKAARPFFDLRVVHDVRSVFQELEQNNVDLVMVDVDPHADPDLGALARLQQYAPHTPVVVLLEDAHQAQTLNVLERGAHHTFTTGQVTEEIFPALLLRAMGHIAAQKTIKASEERFRLLIENASDVILVLNDAGVVTYASPSAEHILHKRPADLLDKNLLDFIDQANRRTFLDAFEKAFVAGGTVPFMTFRFRINEGQWLHMEGRGRVTLNHDAQKVCILNAHDVSHRIKLEEELRFMSLRDELTGLHNRRSFITCLDQQLKVAARLKKGLSLLFIDLDDFKPINDTLGHEEGDHALIDAAQILKKTFRDADIIARLGGDEFAVCLSDHADVEHVELLKKRLIESVDEWNKNSGRPYRILMSVGAVVQDPKHRRAPADLLREADELMYRQKRAKKGLRGDPISIVP